jgi:hypothetical protein
VAMYVGKIYGVYIERLTLSHTNLMGCFCISNITQNIFGAYVGIYKIHPDEENFFLFISFSLSHWIMMSGLNERVERIIMYIHSESERVTLLLLIPDT